MDDITDTVKKEMEKFKHAVEAAGLQMNLLGARQDALSPLKDEPSILPYGAGGTGKTYSLKTMPEPALIIDLEGGTQELDIQNAYAGKQFEVIRIPSDFPDGKEPFLDSSGRLMKRTKKAVAWDLVTRSLDLILASSNLHGFNCIGLDTITAAADAALTLVVSADKGAMPKIQHYGSQMYKLKTQLIYRIRQITTWNPNRRSIPFVCLGHRSATPFGDTVYFAPQITGKLATEIARFFREEYLTERVWEGENKPSKYYWLPNPKDAEAKSTFGFIGRLEQDYTKLIKAITEKRLKALEAMQSQGKGT